MPETKRQLPRKAYYRLYDRYRKPIATIAVLADSNPNWRPAAYQAKAWGSEFLLFRYFTVKLLDYKREKDKLLETSNPFGTVVLAFLAAQETKKDIGLRYQEKFRLTRRLCEQGLNRDAVLNLYKFIDWSIALPENLEIRYNESIKALEEEKSVSYITSAERIGIQKGPLVLNCTTC